MKHLGHLFVFGLPLTWLFGSFVALPQLTWIILASLAMTSSLFPFVVVPPASTLFHWLVLPLLPQYALGPTTLQLVRPSSQANLM